MHYLLYGFGLQTWEYRFDPFAALALTVGLSPLYALRSYLYILIHAIFGKVADFPIRVILGMNKVLLELTPSSP